MKECSDLEKMGTISHLHTREELLTKYGADIARNDAAQKFTDLAEGLIPIVAELFRIEKDRSVSLGDGNSGRVKMIRGLSGLSPEEEKEKWLKSRADGLTHFITNGRSSRWMLSSC